MRNLRLEIEYDGAGFAGWQAQNSPQSTVHSPEKKTIQGIIEKTLQKILQEKVKVVGSGRTDAGVSALAQTAHFTTQSLLPADKIKHALNAFLPEDISISRAREVPINFHAIRDAKSKLYCYTILTRDYKPALLRQRVYYCRPGLNLPWMRREARCLIGRHDFKAFCASASSARSTIRTIKKLTIRKYPYFYPALTSQAGKDASLILIDIEADGFLYNMARNITGTLIEVGRGKLAKGSLKKILLSKDRRRAGPTAPAQGLCLIKVRY